MDDGVVRRTLLLYVKEVSHRNRHFAAKNPVISDMNASVEGRRIRDSTTSEHRTSKTPITQTDRDRCHKRPAFLSDLRDRKKFNPGKSKSGTISVPDGHQVIEVSYTNLHTDALTIDSNKTTVITIDESHSNPLDNSKRQVNWLAAGSRDASATLLNQGSESKQRKATVAMRYGW